MEILFIICVYHLICWLFSWQYIFSQEWLSDTKQMMLCWNDGYSEHDGSVDLLAINASWWHTVIYYNNGSFNIVES